MAYMANMFGKLSKLSVHFFGQLLASCDFSLVVFYHDLHHWACNAIGAVQFSIPQKLSSGYCEGTTSKTIASIRFGSAYSGRSVPLNPLFV